MCACVCMNRKSHLLWCTFPILHVQRQEEGWLAGYHCCGAELRFFGGTCILSFAFLRFLTPFFVCLFFVFLLARAGVLCFIYNSDVLEWEYALKPLLSTCPLQLGVWFLDCREILMLAQKSSVATEAWGMVSWSSCPDYVPTGFRRVCTHGN